MTLSQQDVPGAYGVWSFAMLWFVCEPRDRLSDHWLQAETLAEQQLPQPPTKSGGGFSASSIYLFSVLLLLFIKSSSHNCLMNFTQFTQCSLCAR